MGWNWDEGPPPTERDRRYAENTLRQFDRVVADVDAALAARQFSLTPELVRELNRLAVQDLEPTAGQYRTADNEIAGSKHEPPPWQDVPRLVEEMCLYVNDLQGRRGENEVIHYAAYVMWRLNWIHPFADGNGRTARAASYLVMCVHLGVLLPGEVTVPERIARNRFPYNDALEAADAAYKAGRVDVTAMEDLLIDLLADQLARLP